MDGVRFIDGGGVKFIAMHEWCVVRIGVYMITLHKFLSWACYS